MSRAEIYRRLARKYGYTVNEIADMTPYAQMLMLTRRNEDGSVYFASDAEYRDWLAKRGS